MMVNITWRRFDQSAKQLIVGHTTNDNGRSAVIHITEAKQEWRRINTRRKKTRSARVREMLILPGRRRRMQVIYPLKHLPRG